VSAPAIVVDHAWKRFRLYRERNRSLKSAIMRGRRSAIEREFWAIRDVSFEVQHGETLGVIGRNGSGKSTLLKTLARILTPDRGAVRTSGRVAALLEVGSGFHPELTGRENIFLNGSILGMSRREVTSQFDGIVEFSGVGAFIDQPVKNYSSGMYVRLGFSVAVHVKPDILLVDEVLAVGDAEFQERSQARFRELTRSGRTVVIVSHGLDDVRALCTRTAWLDHGELRQIGATGDVVDAYLAGLDEP